MDNQPNHNPVQPINPRPSFEQPQQQPPAIQAHTPKKKGRGLKTVLIILLVLLAAAGVGAGVYFWQQNEELSAKVSDLETRIATMTEEADAAKETDLEEAEETPQGNIINISELGVSITVPESLADLTYHYENTGGDSSAAYFSTRTLSQSDPERCDASSGPLGVLSKNNGVPTTEAEKEYSVLEGQDYFFIFQGPQALCSDQPFAEDAADLVFVLSKAIEDSIKEN